MNERMRGLLGDVLELAEPVDADQEEFVIPGDLYREIHALFAAMAAPAIMPSAQNGEGDAWEIERL